MDNFVNGPCNFIADFILFHIINRVLLVEMTLLFLKTRKPCHCQRSKSSQIFIILALIRRSVYVIKVPELNSAAYIAQAIQFRKNVAALASRWRHCVRYDRPGIEPQIYRTNNNVHSISANHRYFEFLLVIFTVDLQYSQKMVRCFDWQIKPITKFISKHFSFTSAKTHDSCREYIL